MGSKKDFSSVESLVWKDYAGDPLSPPEGEAAQVELPRYPISLFLISQKENSRQSIARRYYIFMDAKAGTKAKVPAARKSLRTFSDDFYNDKILIKNFGYSHNLTTDIEIDL
jgi:hypothetical protein